jgi:hypothetical protein
MASHKRLVAAALALTAALVLAVVLVLLLRGGRTPVSPSSGTVWRPGFEVVAAPGSTGKPVLRPGPTTALGKLVAAERPRGRPVQFKAGTSYRWRRCGPAGDGCVDIPGATGASYVLVAADTGHSLRVLVDGAASEPYGATGDKLGSGLAPRMPESRGAKNPRRWIFVSPTGSDENRGTKTSPYESVCEALAHASSGTVVQLRGNSGHYGEDGGYSATQLACAPHKAFSALDPVTIQTFPGDVQAVFTGMSSVYTNALTIRDVTGLRIRNVTFAARYNTNLKLFDVHDVELDHVLVKDAGRGCLPDDTFDGHFCSGTGVTVGGDGDGGADRNAYSDRVQIWNSVLTNNGCTSSTASGAASGGCLRQAHSYYLGSCGQQSRAGGTGGLDHFVVANNLNVDNPVGGSLQIGDCGRNGLVTNNTIDNTTAGHYEPSTGSGIVAYDKPGTATPSIDNLIVNNLVTNSTASAATPSTTRTYPEMLYRNNLGFHNGYDCSYNGCTTDWQTRFGSFHAVDDQGNLPSADPRYLSVNSPELPGVGNFGCNCQNYRLGPGSAAIGKAEPAYTPPTDLDGNLRPIHPSLGAYG